MVAFSILILLPIIGALFCFFVKDIKKQYILSLIIAIVHLNFSLLIFFGYYQAHLVLFFSVDSLSKFFLIILSNVYFWVIVVSYSFLKRPLSDNAQKSKKFYFLLLNFI